MISFSNAKAMLAANSDKNAEEFKAGLYHACDAHNAETVANLAELIKAEANFKYAFDTRFVASMYYCITAVKGFDPKVFMRKLLHNPKALVRCATHKQYMEMLSGIYNYKTTETHKVRFLLA
ncbi:hypothetical protein [Hymenobacter ruricola]|uniref:Uncharacterized protein n=1 Tax=Hymenobacter ruricola TaxID=2791023 RepID=A0ABS0I6E2_9BACT|nr:hypothetical protein [Hymenobacter ruricola]MBF9222526.1 hypothetical protein [Hymenobacter ruricola]